MDGNTASLSITPEVVQPETDFAEFFYGVISKLYDLKNRQIQYDVKTALREMRRLKFETDNFQKKTYFSFKPPQVRCAYLYAYSVLHSIMVYSEFSNLLKQSKMLLLPACHRDSLKICCLGGGPGIEAVAICRSISELILGPISANDNFVLEVHTTMIDKLPHWRREESAVINALNDSSNVLHSGRIIYHSEFLRADLLKPFEKNLREKIMEADIVTVVKLAVSIQENSPENCDGELQHMMEDIIESMREDSCLFMLDTAGGKVFNNMVKCLKGKRPNSRLKTSLHKDYSLDISTRKKFEDMMSKKKKDPNYRPVLPTMKGKVSASLWMKNISALSENNNVSNGNVDKTSNITNSTCAEVQSEKDVKNLGVHSGNDLKTLNDDNLVPTDSTKSKEPEKKTKRARKRELKSKSNKKS